MKAYLILFVSFFVTLNFRGQDTIKVESNKMVYTIVEKPAEFEGGVQQMMNFIKTNIVFPEVCGTDSSFRGCKVFLKFVVNEDGSISDKEILKGCDLCPACNSEALRVVAIMPRWRPAVMKGVNVRSYLNLPFNFKIQ